MKLKHIFCLMSVAGLFWSCVFNPGEESKNTNPASDLAAYTVGHGGKVFHGIISSPLLL
jgi:hypothetical protein